MKQSFLFNCVKKQPVGDEPSLNAKFLIQGGYIDRTMAGVYSLLPLGWRVVGKIAQIIREEMNGIGGQELYLPAMQPKANWQQTGRWESLDVLYRLEEQGLAFGPTHEEIITPLVKKIINSYKDLPVYLYQIQNKFRQELRAKSGLLRGREFLMKDLYSFHANEEDLNEYYEKVKAAYERIFQRVGLGEVTHYTFASGGTFSKYSHEFQAVCPAGEDKIHICQKCGAAVNEEIKGEVTTCPECGGREFAAQKGVELGNIFKLKTKYSEPFKLTFQDASGKEQLVIMGCYGIGLQRLMGAVVEIKSDGKNIVWPEALAPFKFHLIPLNLKVPAVAEATEKIYQDLNDEYPDEVLLDDRDLSAGQKFAEADFIGAPVRLVVSEKTLATDQVEVQLRASGETKLVGLKELKKVLATV